MLKTVLLALLNDKIEKKNYIIQCVFNKKNQYLRSCKAKTKLMHFLIKILLKNVLLSEPHF